MSGKPVMGTLKKVMVVLGPDKLTDEPRERLLEEARRLCSCTLKPSCGNVFGAFQALR